MSVKYHGKYCGPGWSAGKYQQSVKSAIPADDDFDATCKEHDGAYALPTNSKARSAADDKFFRENIGGGPKRAIAALAVKAASKIMRAQERNPKGTRLRGSQTPPIKRSAVSRARARLNQRKRLTPDGQMINSITNIKLIDQTTPSPTMKRSQKTKNGNNKYKSNNAVSKAPVAQSRTIRARAPQTTMKKGVTTITHREYVTPVIAQTGTGISSLKVNPGLQTAFTWLSNVATSYEMYEFTKLTYTYVSAAATSERGRVSLSFQYDPTADSPITRSDHFAIIPNVEEAPWEDMVLSVPCTHPRKYIRAGAIGNGTYNTYDYGKIHVMTAMNADSTTQLGELFVDYTVKLYNPQFAQVGGGEIDSNPTSSSQPFGTSFTISSGNPPFLYKGVNSFYVNTSQPMLVSVIVSGTTLTYPTSFALTTTGGSSGTLSTKRLTVNGAATESIGLFSLKGCEPGDYVTMNGAAATLSDCKIYTAPYINQ